jgi:hypothetical protein
MKQMSLTTGVIAASTFACAALLSFGWSEQRGVSLSIESAQARVGRPLTPVSVAGVARRQNRRAAYGYGAGVVGAGVAAAAIGTAAAAATSPWGYYGGGYYGGGPYAYAGGPYTNAGYFAASPWGHYECRNPHGYACDTYDPRIGTALAPLLAMWPVLWPGRPTIATTAAPGSAIDDATRNGAG